MLEYNFAFPDFSDLVNKGLCKNPYKAAVFDQDRELSPEVERVQLKILDEQEIWIPNLEVKK